MGCFSYLCQICDKPINSTSFTGEGVKLWLLQNGKVLEEKEGNYDSYGGVLDEHEWKNDWSDICDLNFNNHSGDGIAAIHTDCWYKSDRITPTTKSEDDENQGCGKLKRKEAFSTWSRFYEFIDKTPTKEDIERDLKLKELGERTFKIMKEAEVFLNSSKAK